MLKADRPICNTGTINKMLPHPFGWGFFCLYNYHKNIRIFESRIAPSRQGSLKRKGGAKQILIPNRRQWTDAVKIEEFKIE